jgi:glycosyl hydrolase family 25
MPDYVRLEEEARQAFDEHLKDCPICQRAARTHLGCLEGQRLHEQMVRAAHARFHEGGGVERLRRMLEEADRHRVMRSQALLLPSIGVGDELVDASLWQGVINFDVYPYKAISIKATEGLGFTDSMFARNAGEANRKGLRKVCYGFCRPDLGGTPEAEADYLWAVAAPYMNPGDALEADLETGNPSQDYVDRYIARLQQYAIAWLYSAAWFMNPRGLQYRGATHAAAYGSVAPAADVWQFTDAASVPGIAGGVDLNRVLNPAVFGDAPAPQEDLESMRQRLVYHDTMQHFLYLVPGGSGSATLWHRVWDNKAQAMSDPEDVSTAVVQGESVNLSDAAGLDAVVMPGPDGKDQLHVFCRYADTSQSTGAHFWTDLPWSARAAWGGNSI